MKDRQPGRRTIRSFVRRTGRQTASQSEAIRRLWPAFGIEFDGRALDVAALFGREADTVLEIGFGNGESLVAAAAGDPARNYLGVEVHEPGIGHCLIAVRRAGIGNLRLIRHDAMEVLGSAISRGSLARINLLFPDPWPKKRHHKRRIVQRPFLALAARALRTGGSLHIATDWADYATHIDETLANCCWFRLDERREHAGNEPLDRVTTKFEQRGIARGHVVVDWRCLCVACPADD